MYGLVWHAPIVGDQAGSYLVRLPPNAAHVRGEEHGGPAGQGLVPAAPDRLRVRFKSPSAENARFQCHRGRSSAFPRASRDTLPPENTTRRLWLEPRKEHHPNYDIIRNLAYIGRSSKRRKSPRPRLRHIRAILSEQAEPGAGQSRINGFAVTVLPTGPRPDEDSLDNHILAFVQLALERP